MWSVAARDMRQVRGGGLDGVADPEVAPFWIRTMLVEPGFFRTELLSPESTKYAEASIEDHAERTEQTVAGWKSMNGLQGGDPREARRRARPAGTQAEPPLRFMAGADAVATVEQKAKDPRPGACVASGPVVDDRVHPVSR
jgi:NAD(P)-dependent dehydrogenase (short-subunit alcohol dehydrogenase family)